MDKMLRRFIDYYKPHRKLFFADLFFAFLFVSSLSFFLFFRLTWSDAL